VRDLSVPILDVTGVYAGKRTCYVCEFQNGPMSLRFSATQTRRPPSSSQLDKPIGRRRRFQSRCDSHSGTQARSWLQDSASTKPRNSSSSSRAAERRGVKLYNLDPKVRNTFLVTRNRVVDTNVSDISSTGFDKVKQATLSMLTKSRK
jgi:hypothetical protein